MRKKNGACRSCQDLHPLLPAETLTEHYEVLRTYVLARVGSSASRLGQAALMARGMAAWIQVAGELATPVRSAPDVEGEAARVAPPVQDALIQLMGEVVMTLIRRTA